MNEKKTFYQKKWAFSWFLKFCGESGDRIVAGSLFDDARACINCIIILAYVWRSGRYKYIIKEESAGLYYVALELSTPESIDAATYKLNARNVHGESNANLKLNFDGEYDLSVSKFV